MMNEKETRHFNRTLEHIHRVHKNMFTLITKFSSELELDLEDCRRLAHNVLNHDISKFNTIQFEPYIELTEYYHQRKTLGNKGYEYPTKELKATVKNAIENHYYKENHHAERYDGDTLPMSELELIEVCCDLQAMAQEFKEGSCRGFYENVWRPKYHVPPEVDEFMDKVISCFEKEL